MNDPKEKICYRKRSDKIIHTTKDVRHQLIGIQLVGVICDLEKIHNNAKEHICYNPITYQSFNPSYIMY